MIDRLGLLTGMAMPRPLWSVDGSFRQSRKFALLLRKTEGSSRGARLTLDQPAKVGATRIDNCRDGGSRAEILWTTQLILCVLA
jgi:hypothetical protein